MSTNVPDWVTLTEGESVVWSGHPSLFLVSGPLIAGFLIDLAGVALFVLVPSLRPFPLALLLVGSLLQVLAVVRHRSTEYVITSEEIYRKRGLFSREVTNLRLDRVQNTSFSQSFGQRLLSLGDVRVDTAGTSRTEVVLSGVSDPSEVNAVIARQLDRR